MTIKDMPDDNVNEIKATSIKPAGLGSLFSAAAAASSNKQITPWQQAGGKPRHEKKIGAAPNGTRRSMGKR